MAGDDLHGGGEQFRGAGGGQTEVCHTEDARQLPFADDIAEAFGGNRGGQCVDPGDQGAIVGALRESYREFYGMGNTDPDPDVWVVVRKWLTSKGVP